MYTQFTSRLIYKNISFAWKLISPTSSNTGEIGKRPVITLPGSLTGLRLIRNILYSYKGLVQIFFFLPGNTMPDF